MALLGQFREGIDNVRFHLIANRPVVPGSVFIIVTPNGGGPIVLSIGPDPDSDLIPNNEFRNVPDLTLAGANLGIALVDYGAADTQGIPAQKSDTIRVISSYGRNYGEDYGNGL